MGDDDIADVAERLVEEFSDLPPIRVLEAVSDAAGEYVTSSPMFLEQAARARLLSQRPLRVRETRRRRPRGGRRLPKRVTADRATGGRSALA